MRITDFKNEDAIDLLADIIEPTAKILADSEIQKLVNAKTKKIDVVKAILKLHKGEIIEIIARVNGVEPENYNCNIVTLTKDIVELLNDKELIDFFLSQGQMMATESSTSVMANTEVSVQ